MSNDNPSSNGNPSRSGRDGFWRQPPETHFAPPFPGADYEIPSGGTVKEFCAFLRNCGLEPRAYDLTFQYHNSLLPAVQDHLAVMETLAQEMESVLGALEQVRRDRFTASEDFVSAMAEAGLPLDPEAHVHGDHHGADESNISPTRVEYALDQDCARPEEIAGRYGIEPPEDSQSWIRRLLEAVPSWILPIAVGLVFGINLAVLTGFIDLDRLARGQGLVYAVLGVVAGIAIEAAAGYGAAGAARLFAQAAEPDRFDEGSFPRHRGGHWLSAIVTALVIVLAAGIVSVDALGLRELHQQTLRASLVKDWETLLQPMWVYLVAGVVISVPYLMFKFLRGWFSSANRLRHARIALLAQRYLGERRKDTAVVRAFGAAQRVQDLREEEDWLKARIQKCESRHDAARAAACREAAAFRATWDALVETLSESRSPQIEAQLGSRAVRSDADPHAAAATDQQHHGSAVARMRDAFRRAVDRHSRREGDGYLG